MAERQCTVDLSSVSVDDWSGLSRFFATRTIAGLARVDHGTLLRGTPSGPVSIGVVDGVVVGRASAKMAPEVLRRVVDADRDLREVAAGLAAVDPQLAERLTHVALPRLPGAFDRFEILVRAIVGQQISVPAARTTLGRLCELADPIKPGLGSPGSLRPGFPTPAQVADAPLGQLGMPGRRRDCLRRCSAAVADGTIDLGADADPDALTEQLLRQGGIGPWTAGYVAMRALGAADAWPVGDLVLRQSLGADAKELAQRAESWRPWRAYASLLLWATRDYARPSQ